MGPNPIPNPTSAVGELGFEAEAEVEELGLVANPVPVHFGILVAGTLDVEYSSGWLASSEFLGEELGLVLAEVENPRPVHFRGLLAGTLDVTYSSGSLMSLGGLWGGLLLLPEDDPFFFSGAILARSRNERCGLRFETLN
jgi:hypothetical protein